MALFLETWIVFAIYHLFSFSAFYHFKCIVPAFLEGVRATLPSLRLGFYLEAWHFLRMLDTIVMES